MPLQSARSAPMFSVLISSLLSLTTGESVLRDTVYGQVRGYVHTVLDTQKVERYLGIPFAAPPVGKLRFEYPEEPSTWRGVLNVTSHPPACPQIESEWSYIHMHKPGYSLSDEDCLYINIYVPQTGGAESKMAVLVHIHGGSNEVGMGAMFDGDVLAAMGGIIVVNFNYRLGPLGFLSGQSDEFPGNYGLMDQTQALRWVNKNIHFFGGDPDKVTVEGHSAGGGNVGFHILSPLSKGLFRYAIMQSGSPTAYWALLRPPADAVFRTMRFAEKLGCYSAESQDVEKIKECLKTKTWEKVINEQYEYVAGMYNFSPIIDNIFLESDPESILEDKQLNGESYMTGVTRDEGSLTASIVHSSTNGGISMTPAFVKSVSTIEINLADIAVREAAFIELTVYARTFTPPPQIMRNIPEIIDLVVHEYKPWNDPDNQTANIIGLSDVVGDSTFVAPAVDVANRLSKRTNRVYFYSFEYHSPLSAQPSWIGVPHGRDQFYLFGYPFTGHPLYAYSDEDREVSRSFMSMWSNYVKTGIPSITVDNEKTEFPEFDWGNQTYMKITGIKGKGSITTAQRLRPRKVAFWNSLLPRMRDKPLKFGSTEYGALTWILAVLCGVLFVCLIISLVCTVHYRHHGSPTTYSV